MKTLKTYEIWKMIDEDYENMRGKKYKSSDGSRQGEYYISKSCGGDKGLFLHNRIVENLTGFEEWEEVKQAVDFMTAVKSGKKLIVEHDRLNREDMDFLQETYHFLGTIWECFSDFLNSQDIREVILNGKWYIE